MLYTCRVKCFDGVVRTREAVGYFTNTDVLRHQLAMWNGVPGPAGEPYQYFETPAQVAHNDGTCCIPYRLLPLRKTLYHGNQMHDYEMKDV